MTPVASWRLPLAALALGLVLAAPAGAVPSCGALCAGWQLDPSASADPKAAIDTALAGYKEEKPRRRRPPPSDFAGLAKAELDDSLGPMHERPMRDELRQQLTRQLTVPETLHISQAGDEILIDEGGKSPRRFDLEESYSRVDSVGTAEVSARLSGNSFTVRENYKRGRDNRETYEFDAHTDRLVVTRTIARPSMPKLVLKSVYRPLY